MSLFELPQECVWMVCRHLLVPDLLRLTMSCCQFWLLRQQETCWEIMLWTAHKRRHYPKITNKESYVWQAIGKNKMKNDIMAHCHSIIHKQDINPFLAKVDLIFQILGPQLTYNQVLPMILRYKGPSSKYTLQQRILVINQYFCKDKKLETLEMIWETVKVGLHVNNTLSYLPEQLKESCGAILDTMPPINQWDDQVFYQFWHQLAEVFNFDPYNQLDMINRRDIKNQLYQIMICSRLDEKQKEHD